MQRLKIDERIIRVLEAVLNAKSVYSSVNVNFHQGRQSVGNIYVSPKTGMGGHLISHSGASLDEALAIAKNLEDKGDIKSLISSIEKDKREALKNITEDKERVKYLDLTLTKLLEMEG